jgi:hypothetical protein
VFLSIDPRTVHSIILVRRDALDYGAELALTTITRSIVSPAAPARTFAPSISTATNSKKRSRSKAAEDEDGSVDREEEEEKPFKMSEKEGNVKKRAKRASDEYKQQQKIAIVSGIAKLKEDLGSIDCEREVCDEYLDARKLIPSDDDLIG